MKHNIQDNSHANITFNTLAKVAVRGDHSYTVKWYLDNEFVGEMNLGGGNWGGYENRIGNWRIEFWQDNNLVSTYHNDLKGENVLLITSFGINHKGKIADMSGVNSGINNFIDEVEHKYGCNVYVYFAGSEKFELPFRTLKMNDNIDFKIITEIQF